jgi:hypothetical protein
MERMKSTSSKPSQENATYTTEINCENCPETFRVGFNDPSEPFEGTCPHCDTHYPELYV